MILFILSFVAGVLTILAPCVLPILPLIVGSSLSGADTTVLNKKKAFTISVSLGVSIIAFTLLLKVSTIFIAIPQEVWSIISGIIIIIFGLISLLPDLWGNLSFVNKFSQDSNQLMSAGYNRKSFVGDIIIGASLGPVFSACSPTYFLILATVLPQSVFLGVIDLVAYAVGLSGMVLLVAFLGQKIVNRLGGLSDPRGWFKRTLGAIFILLGIAILFGFDKVVEAKLLDSGVFDITRVEQSLLQLNDKSSVTNGVDTSSTTGGQNNVQNGTGTPSATNGTSGNTTNSTSTSATAAITTHGPKAPEIVNPSGFINTEGKPITIGQFKGKKVVLLDVWTYSCINCRRTLPYVIAWYNKYKDQGLEVIGLHTPEFAFEKVLGNVQDAVKKFGITYPIVMDNDYSTWTAYGNQYWPRKYLINMNGEIIYDHIGEGDYDVTEREIQKALAELNQANSTGATVSTSITQPTNEITVDPTKVNSPETYFGASRNTYLGNGTKGAAGDQTLTLPDTVLPNTLYLSGTWNFQPEYAQSTTASKIIFKYSAKNVYMVASSDSPMDVKVYKDGTFQKTVTIQKNTLYTLIEGSDYGEHTLEIDAPSGGLQAFTFTFG